MKIRDYFIYFIFYSFLGWIYETVLEVFIYHWGFSNRGVLFGPVLPVYGFGALIFLLVFNKFLKRLSRIEKFCMIPTVFLGCMFMATSVELLTSYLCEMFSGSWPWNYTRYPFNFEGRIALNPSIRFGLGGLFFLYIMQPIFEIFTKKGKTKTLNFVFTLFVIFFIRDLIYKFVL